MKRSGNVTLSCVACDAVAPPAPTRAEARSQARSLGWTRRGDDEWTCPEPSHRGGPQRHDGVRVTIPYVTFDRLAAKARAEGLTVVEYLADLA